jgi:hypothetical protein
MKDLFASVAKCQGPGEGGLTPTAFKMMDLVKLRPLPSFNVSTPLYTVLNYFQTGHAHLALVTTGRSILCLDQTAVPIVKLAGSTNEGETCIVDTDTFDGSRGGGEVLGIITLEDILEEIINEEILDEYDRESGMEADARATNDSTLLRMLRKQNPVAPPRDRTLSIEMGSPIGSPNQGKFKFKSWTVSASSSKYSELL